MTRTDREGARTDQQIDLARQLVAELVNCGHDITTVDLLDCAASAGLKLVADTDGMSTASYQELLRRGRMT